MSDETAAMQHHGEHNLTRGEVREMVDAFDSYSYDEERANVMYEVAEVFYEDGREDIAQVAERLAGAYSALVDDFAGVVELPDDFAKSIQALLDFYRWSDDGAVPAGDIGVAVERAGLLGDEAGEYKLRLAHVLDLHAYYERPLVEGASFTAGQAAVVYKMAIPVTEPGRDELDSLREVADEMADHLALWVQVSEGRPEHESVLDSVRHLREVADGRVLAEPADGWLAEAGRWLQDLGNAAQYTARFNGLEVREFALMLERVGWGDERPHEPGSLEELRGFINLERTVVIGRSAQAVAEHLAEAPFLADLSVERVTGFAQDHEIEHRHVFGELPLHLEALAETVTRHDTRAMSQDLVTYRVDEVVLSMDDIKAAGPVYVTTHPEQVACWREHGLIGAEQSVYLVTHSINDAVSLDHSKFDANTYLMVVIQPGDVPNSALFGSNAYVVSIPDDDWGDFVPEDAVVVYADVGYHGADLVSGRHVVGDLPPRLKNEAAQLTTFAYDSGTGQYGAGATYRTEVLMRTSLQ